MQPARDAFILVPSYLVFLRGGKVLRYLHAVGRYRGIFLQLQEVHGFLPLASGDGRLDGFKRAARRGEEVSC